MVAHELVYVGRARGEAGKRTTFWGRCSCGHPIGSSANPASVSRKHRTHAAEASGAPRFVLVAPGDYETTDGVFRLRQLDGGATQAWNVEWTTAFEYDHAYDALPGYPVDGARTKADALALFAEWWAENGHPDPDWKRS